MIVLNECRISPDGKCLIVEATVDSLKYFDNVYIDSVIVDTDETYLPSGPNEEKGYKVTFEGENIKNVKLSITAKEMGLGTLDNNIFFVYVIVTPTSIPSPDTPCGMDNEFVMGIAVNLRPVYNMAMGYIRELDDSCQIPKGFIDMILRLKAFELSLKTGNYPTAFHQWKTLFKNKVSVSPVKKCGCHGPYS